MIKTLSDILRAFLKEEDEKLQQYKLDHAPTIGKMYEGLTSATLERMIPLSLNLKIVSGFIHDGGDNLSGEIDCMLVKGVGEQIPHTDLFKWHAKDVLVIFEVKKNLYSDGLKDSFIHLRDAVGTYGSYINSINHAGSCVSVEPARRAFEEICGRSPEFSGGEADHTHEVIYHTLVMEQLSPVRIILGFNSYKSEYAMRDSLVKFISENKMERGFGIGSFPQLMICGDYSLVKLNGQPYSSIMQDEYWDFYASSNENPVLLMLEIVWTKISNETDASFPWGDDLQEENLARLLGGRIRSLLDKTGWEYRWIEVSRGILDNRLPNSSWEPLFVDAVQFTVFNILCNKSSLDTESQDFLDFIGRHGLEKSSFIEKLVKTGMVKNNSNILELSTYECRCAILPDGRFAVAEDNSGRFSRWLANQMSKKA